MVVIGKDGRRDASPEVRRMGRRGKKINRSGRRRKLKREKDESET